MKSFTVLVAALGLLVAPAQAKSRPESLGLVWKVTYNHPRPALLRFFRDYYQREDLAPNGTPSNPDAYLDIATLRLADRRTELSLILAEGTVCGTGGCFMDMVLSRDRGQSFHRLGTVGMLDLPVRVLPTSHQGLPDLLVDIDNVPPTRDGHPPDRSMVMIFDGRHHPEDAERRLSYHMVGHVVHRTGRVVIPGSYTGTQIPLYPPEKAVPAPAEKK